MGHRSLDVSPSSGPTLGLQQAQIDHHPQGVVPLAGIVTLMPGNVLWGATLWTLSMMNPWLQICLPRQRPLESARQRAHPAQQASPARYMLTAQSKVRRTPPLGT